MSFSFLPTGGITDPSGNLLAIQSYQGQPAANGVNTLIAAQPGKSIYVLAYALQATGTVNPNLQDSGGTALTPVWNFQAREGIVRAPSPGFYYFATAVGKGLNLNLSAAVGVNVEIQYVVF